MTSGVLAFAEKRRYLRSRRDCADTSGTRDFNARVTNIEGEFARSDCRLSEEHEISGVKLAAV